MARSCITPAGEGAKERQSERARRRKARCGGCGARPGQPETVVFTRTLLIGIAVSLPLLTASGAAPKSAPKAPAPAGTVTGRVLLPDGKPAVRAKVWLGWADVTAAGFLEGQADAQGAFRLALGRKTIAILTVGAAGPGTAPAWRVLKASPAPVAFPKPAPITLKLAAPVALSGRAVKADGSAAAGLRVTVTSLHPVSTTNPLFPPVIERLLPPSVRNGLYTHSGTAGAFKISGLTPGAEAVLELPREYLPLGPRGAVIRLGRPGVQPVGVVYARRTGQIQVAAQNAQGSAAPGATVWIRRVVPAPADPLAEALGSAERAARQEPAPIEVEANGAGLLEGVAPGAYELAFHGKVVPVTVPEGGTAGPTVLRAARLSLSGAVLESGGKAVPNARVVVEVGRPKVDWPPGPGNPVATDAMGRFTLEDFPSEAPLVVVRATAGNGMAEWIGNPATLTGPLTLTLRPGALLTVKGRILRPDGTPMANVPLALFTRDRGAPRALVLGRSEAEGRFRVIGLARGVRFAVGSVAGEQAVESAFHTSPGEGEELELGDLRLAPNRGEDATALTAGLMLAALPAEEEVQKARDAGVAYLEALRRGDAAMVRNLTSGLIPPARLTESHLLTTAEITGLAKERLHPLRVNPRLILEALFGVTDAERRELLLKAADRPEWVPLGYAGAGGVSILALMHREGGVWKALYIPGGEGLTSAPGDHVLFGTPYALLEPEPALAAAREYLTAWRAGDLTALRARTSKQAVEWSEQQAEFRKRWEARATADRAAPEAPDFKPESRYSRWDLGALFAYPRLLAEARSGRGMQLSLERFPYPELKAGKLVVLSYGGSGRKRLMLLVNEAGVWRVLEPALDAGAAD
jgi:hypothetical protein